LVIIFFSNKPLAMLDPKFPVPKIDIFIIYFFKKLKILS
jgi:hypothetical protein